MLANRLRQMFAVGLLACGLIGVGTALAQQFAAPPADPNQPPTVALDPDTGVPVAAQQPKPAEAKKIGAKGIEDDDVPYGSFPTQAVVRIEEGKLIVRQRAQTVEAVPMKNFDGQTVTVYQRKSGVHASTHDPADVAVFDMKGNRLLPKAWKDLLKSDVHALVAHDGKLPNPRELTLFKQDTLLIVLPVSAAPPTPDLPGYVPRTTYVPQTSYVPRTYYEPVTPTAPAVPPSVNVPTAPAITPPAPRPLTPESIPPKYRAPLVPPPAPGRAFPPAPSVPQNFSEESLPPLNLPGDVHGTITRDLAGDLLQIDIGRDAGLEPGAQLDVYRVSGTSAKYLGTLTLSKSVEPKEAVGVFKPARAVAIKDLRADELPRKGDSVGTIKVERARPTAPTVEEAPLPPLPNSN